MRARMKAVVALGALLAALLPLIIGGAPPVAAAVGDISRIAGSSSGYVGNCTDPLLAQFWSPSGIATAPDGSVRVMDIGNTRVRKIYAGGASIENHAGSGAQGFGGDGGPATSAALNPGVGVAVDGVGNTYIADAWNNRVRRVSPAGTISTIAGTGTAGNAGDGGQAAAAQLSFPDALGYHAGQNLLVVGTTDRLRIIDLDTGKIESAVTGFAASGVVVAPDASSAYVSVYNAHRVYQVDLKTGAPTVVAGTGVAGFSGDGGAGPAAQLNQPFGMALLGSTHLLVADGANHRIRTIRLSDTRIGTWGGTGVSGGGGDGNKPDSAQFATPADLDVDAAGNVWIVEAGGHRVRMVDTDDEVSTVAGTGLDGYAGDSDSVCVTADQARFSEAYGIEFDGEGNLYVADNGNERVRRIDAETNLVSTVAGTGQASSTGDGGHATQATMDGPYGLAVDANGDVYVSELAGKRVRKISADTGEISTVVGTGVDGSTGDGGPATSATIEGVYDVHVAPDGALLVADAHAHRIRRVDPITGIITRIAGLGMAGYAGDGGPATTAQLWNPRTITTDAVGNLFIGDGNIAADATDGARIRRVDAATGVITTVAGNGTNGFAGDGGPAVDAEFFRPHGLAVDDAGSLYVSDRENYRVRKVDAETGIVTTIAGTGTSGSGGDGGPATAAALAHVFDLAMSPDGDLHLAQAVNGRIRAIDLPASATGFLRVTTTPAVPATISVDGVARDSWGLTWLPIATGEHEVCFGAVGGFTPPPCEVVEVLPGQTTVVDGAYVQRGFLRVTTTPAVPSTITVDGVARNDWGVWTEVDPGTYEVCFGAVEGFDVPSCQDAVVAAGTTATVDGVFAANGPAPGPAGPGGFLRVTTTPASGSRITVDGEWADSWGLTWTRRAPGSYEVCFEEVLYATAPACETAVVTDGATTVVDGDFVPHGFVQVSTSPALPAVIHVDGHRANAWGVYTSMEPGEHSVCFGPVAFWWSPPCEVIDVTAGVTTSVIGDYDTD